MLLRHIAFLHFVHFLHLFGRSYVSKSPFIGTHRIHISHCISPQVAAWGLQPYGTQKRVDLERTVRPHCTHMRMCDDDDDNDDDKHDDHDHDGMFHVLTMLYNMMMLTAQVVASWCWAGAQQRAMLSGHAAMLYCMLTLARLLCCFALLVCFCHHACFCTLRQALLPVLFYVVACGIVNSYYFQPFETTIYVYDSFFNACDLLGNFQLIRALHTFSGVCNLFNALETFSNLATAFWIFYTMQMSSGPCPASVNFVNLLLSLHSDFACVSEEVAIAVRQS